MYSRNQSRAFADDEFEDEELSDEYELYGYNLPPNYDGSRFQRTRKRSSPPKPRYTHPPRDTVSREEKDEVQSPPLHTEESGTLSLLDALGGRFGYEEMLIISLILILAAEKDCADTVLLLTLLLIAN